MKIIRCKHIPPSGFKAITILGCIITHPHTVLSDRVIWHEQIHLIQEQELLYIGFYLLYVLEFILKLVMYRNWDRAYRAISFEREAYEHEFNGNYPAVRKHYAWKRYIKGKAYYED